MKTNMKNYLLMGRFFLLGVAGASLLTACSDDDDPDPVALTTPVKSGEAVATLNSLTFNWQSVTGASNYSYVLKDASGNVVSSGTTTNTSINFSGLAAGSTYTLEVTANPSATDTASLASSTLTMTGTTQGYIQLAAPTVSAQTAAVSVISWSAVSNAESYTYSYELDGTKVEETTTETSLTLNFLPVDTDVTFSVVAKNSSNEQYTDSEAGTVVAKRTREVVESVEGFNVYAPTESTRTLISYSDGSYVIPAWYGVEGYDFEFMLNADGGIVPNAWYQDGWYWLGTGVDENGSWFYVDGGYGALEGDFTYGDIWFWDNAANNYYYYAWHHYNGTWTKPDGTEVNTFVQDNYDGSYTIKNWYGYEGYDFTFTLGDNNEIIPSSEYYYDETYYSYWVNTDNGVSEYGGVWIYTTGGYSAWDETGIWFWDYGTNSAYWLQIPTEE
jgi:hypothetical protein